MTMKKILMATAAMTLMTMSVLTSCTIEDNPAPPELSIVDPVADVYLNDDDMDRDVRQSPISNQFFYQQLSPPNQLAGIIYFGCKSAYSFATLMMHGQSLLGFRSW